MNDISLAIGIDRKQAFEKLTEEILELQRAPCSDSIEDELDDVYFSLFNLSGVLLDRPRTMDLDKVVDKISNRLLTYGTLSKLVPKVVDETLIRDVKFGFVHFTFGCFKQANVSGEHYKNGTEAEIFDIVTKALSNPDQGSLGNHVILTFAYVSEITIKPFVSNDHEMGNATILVMVPGWLHQYAKSNRKFRQLAPMLSGQLSQRLI